MTKRTRRQLTGATAVCCALLDAAAFQLDLGAAAGRRSLVRAPLAMFARAAASSIRFWNTCWVGRSLGLGWAIRTFRRGMRSGS